MQNTLFTNFSLVTAPAPNSTSQVYDFTESTGWNRPTNFDGEFYFDNIRLENDDKLESLAYRHYGNADYWDVILYYNNIPSIFDIPVNSNIVQARAQESFDAWITRYGERYSTEQRQTVFNRMLEEENTRNERFRNIRLLRERYIPEYVLAVKGS